MRRVCAAGFNSALSVVLVLSGALWLNGCVTTVEGGPQPAASTENRLQAQLALARGYIEADDWQLARRTLERALEIDSRSSEVHTWFALVYEAEGDVSHAEDHYRRALRLDRNNSQALNNYGRYLYQQERYREARQILQRAVEDTSYNARPRAYENLGMTELAMGDTEAARDAFRRALALNPNLANAHLELANISLEDGNNARAREHFTAFRNLENQSPRSLWIGVQLYRALNDMDMASSFALQLRNLYPGSEEYRRYQDEFQ